MKVSFLGLTLHALATSSTKASGGGLSATKTKKMEQAVVTEVEEGNKRTDPNAGAELKQEANLRPEFAAAGDPASLENAKARFLGKAGELTGLLKQLGSLAPEEKKAFGQAALEAFHEPYSHGRRRSSRESARQIRPVKRSSRGSAPGMGNVETTISFASRFAKYRSRPLAVFPARIKSG